MQVDEQTKVEYGRVTIAGKEYRTRKSATPAHANEVVIDTVVVEVPVGPRLSTGGRELVWREEREARRLLLLLDREMRLAVDEMLSAGETYGLDRGEVARVLRAVLLEPSRAAILDVSGPEARR
jgi:hypothetical protein